MKNTEHRNMKKAWRFELLPVICKSAQLKWKQVLLLSIYKQETQQEWGSIVSAAG